ncbi:MAG: hypothetical protein LUQ71_02290 [Methanoregula sp.]|nr:hypothetical protein [Methanoregula sp.]
MMKTMVLLAITVSMLVIAGCTTPVSDSGSAPATPSGASPVLPSTAVNVLSQNGHMALGSGNKTFDVYIDSFELGEEQNGTRDITIYVAAHNTGTRPVMMVWFSKLTDIAGNSYGGIGVSHNGNGARTNWILPNGTEAARDYITIHSNQELLDLSKGAVLDVYFMDKPTDDARVSSVPDYHVAWKIDPGTIF